MIAAKRQCKSIANKSTSFIIHKIAKIKEAPQVGLKLATSSLHKLRSDLNCKCKRIIGFGQTQIGLGCDLEELAINAKSPTGFHSHIKALFRQVDQFNCIRNDATASKRVKDPRSNDVRKPSLIQTVSPSNATPDGINIEVITSQRREKRRDVHSQGRSINSRHVVSVLKQWTQLNRPIQQIVVGALNTSRYPKTQESSASAGTCTP